MQRQECRRMGTLAHFLCNWYGHFITHRKTGPRTSKTGFFHPGPKLETKQGSICRMDTCIVVQPSQSNESELLQHPALEDRTENIRWKRWRVKGQTPYDSILQNPKQVKSLDSVSHQGWWLLLGGGGGEQPEAWEAPGCCALGVLPLWWSWHHT